MTPTSLDRVVEDYLRRLDSAAAALPADDRDELLAEIRAHIDAARDEGAEDEATVRTLLDRLGTPEEIVAAAAPAPPIRVIPRPGTTLELVAVLLMTIGSLFPVVGWLTGVVCMWVSQRWRLWEKVLGTLVFPFGPFAVFTLGGLFAVVFQTGSTRSCTYDSVTGANTCSGSDGSGIPLWVSITGLVVAFVAPIVVDVWLYRRAKRRADAEALSY